MSETAIRAHFEAQARACDDLGSPFTARLCRVLARILDRSTVTGMAVLEWQGNPRADALALRLCGGLHALALADADDGIAGAYPPASLDEDRLAAEIDAAIRRNDEDLVRALDSAPQTNEVGRAAMLLPGFLAIARHFDLPLAVAEIGASAGLNLNFDRFRYSCGASFWGDPASPVMLEPEVRGAPPPLESDLSIVSRHGCDIAPIDLADPAQRLRLRSYVWPDQTLRRQRQDAAIALALDNPVRLERADAAGFVHARLADRPDGAVFVLFHTIMWQYMPRATKDAILAALDEAGANATPKRPIARLRMEPRDPNEPFATLSLTTWPGGGTERLARCDYHGRWIEWMG
jgi:hypothetical protein